MDRLIKVTKRDDILARYRETSVGEMLEYHNLGLELKHYSHARILVGMCMDNRKSLRLPKNFAYIMRTGGANIIQFKFQISYAIGVGGVKCIAIIGHTHCGMSRLEDRKKQFIDGLVKNAGWTAEEAERHFNKRAPEFEIDNEIDFTLGETRTLQELYPKIIVAPLLYKLEDNLLYQIQD